MMRARMAVRNKEKGLLRASKLFEVPKSTLKDKVKSHEQNIEKIVNIRIGRKSVLPESLENVLVSYCFNMEKQFFLAS
jgi:ribosomal protein L13E